MKYPEGYEVRRVKRNGEIKWRGRRRYVGEAFKGVTVGIKQVEEDLNEGYFGSMLLGDFYEIDYKGLRPVIRDQKNDEKKERKSVTYVPGLKCYPCPRSQGWGCYLSPQSRSFAISSVAPS